MPARAADVTATVYVPGSPGLTEPRLVRTIRPNYAAGAARIKGVVKVDALILPDGTVGEARVLRSLQRDLDREALIALRYWLFAPAIVDGQPVGYKAILDLEFGS